MAGAAHKAGNEDEPRLVACRSDYELFTPDGVVFIGGPGGGGELKANSKPDGEKRRELIKAVRGGDHVELQVTAMTFRQRDGSPNKNFLRLNPAKLESIAASYAKQPFLDDHRSWLQDRTPGHDPLVAGRRAPHDWVGFRQELHVVKPEAVISTLDGTLDRFSIAWSRLGAVTCTAHKVDVTKRGSCGCWPGDVVEVDGAKHTVEFEFHDAVGTETSGVNGPAVSGTRIEDVRAALAHELGLSVRQPERGLMLFARLAAILGIASLAAASDEDQAISAVEALKRGKLAAEQERDEARTKLATQEKTAKDALATVLLAAVNAEIEGAYRAGKLRYGRDEDGKAIPSKREDRLRRIAKEDGLAALKAEIGELEAVVPIGKRTLPDGDAARPELAGGAEDMDQALANVAAQLGMKPEELAEYHETLYGQKEA
jgi:hypothetical protein